MKQCMFGGFCIVLIQDEVEFCDAHRPKVIMSNDTKPADIESIYDSFNQLDADFKNIAKLVNHAHVSRTQLIAEARGILESLCVIDGYATGTLTATQYNRLREILDELERLP